MPSIDLVLVGLGRCERGLRGRGLNDIWRFLILGYGTSHDWPTAIANDRSSST